MKNPLISFVIPTINEGKWIEKTLKSIMKQTYKNYEIIVVDSYSQDNTVKLAKKYTHRIIQCDRKGPGFARNKGVKIANGEIIVFLDADTVLEPRFAEKISYTFLKNSIVICGPEIKTLEGNIIHSFLLKLFYIVTSFLIKINRTTLSTVCLTCKKENFFKVNGFNEHLISCEDLDLSFRLGRTGKSKIIDSFCFCSLRRWEKEGNLKIFLEYTLSLFSFIFTRKSEIKDYKFGIFNDNKLN